MERVALAIVVFAGFSPTYKTFWINFTRINNSYESETDKPIYQVVTNYHEPPRMRGPAIKTTQPKTYCANE